MSEESARKHDGFGALSGFLVFLVGVGLLALTFKFAYDMFNVPPERALNISQNNPITLELAGQSFAGILVKVLLLIVMALVGSLVANRGIKLYSDSRHHQRPT